jgi:hypothetical protein
LQSGKYFVDEVPLRAKRLNRAVFRVSTGQGDRFGKLPKIFLGRQRYYILSCVSHGNWRSIRQIP